MWNARVGCEDAFVCATNDADRNRVCLATTCTAPNPEEGSRSRGVGEGTLKGRVRL